MNHTVGLFKCSEYDLDRILEVFRQALSLIEFDTSQLSGKTVLLKPNMLGAYPPEMGITTNPAFLEAAVILFKDLGCQVWVGDSPNGIFPLNSVWERTGFLFQNFDKKSNNYYRFDDNNIESKKGIVLGDFMPGVPIEQILRNIQGVSPDQIDDVETALRDLDENNDGNLEQNEVADQDGYLRCNEATNDLWYYILNPIQNALFQEGLISQLRGQICPDHSYNYAGAIDGFSEGGLKIFRHNSFGAEDGISDGGFESRHFERLIFRRALGL
jgi:hypothetical protein